MAGALEPAVAAYALRLARVFGTYRVGWFLFATFVSLALLHLVQSVAVSSAPSVAPALVSVPIILLLLVGMAHTDAFLGQRTRIERKERQLASELGSQVREKAELRAAYDRLLEQMAQVEQIGKCLEASERQYRSVFTDNPQPMWIFDLRSFRFLAANKVALRDYGFSESEFLALTAKDIRPPGDVPAFVRDSARPGLGGGSWGLTRLYRKDRTLLDVETTSLDLIFDNSPARLVLARDVTQRRLLDQQSRQVEKVEATAQLAGGIAHHFNNLITPVLGYASLLLARLHDPEIVEPLKEISAAANRVAELTRILLAFGGRTAIEDEPLDLNDLLEHLNKTLRWLIGEFIFLNTSYEPGLPSIKGDAALIRQVVVNLVLNARDAMAGRGSLLLRTTCIEVDADYARRNGEARVGEFVCLSVCDTGCGMTEEVRAHLFEPFFTTKDIGKGTGLGLATVYQIVKQHCGWTEVATEPGVGTHVRVLLPSAPGTAT